ncbi:MAG: response regulator [Pseudomonadota bacterium]
MASVLLKGKRILAVDDEWDVLDILQDELEESQVHVGRASTYEEAVEKMAATAYDLVILDIMGVRGLELLEYAAAGKIPVVMLTAHALSPEKLKESIELGARAFLPKDQLGRITPFLEDVLTLSYGSAWKSLFVRLSGAFAKRFAPGWRRSEKEFWDNFDRKMEVDERTIIES